MDMTKNDINKIIDRIHEILEDCYSRLDAAQEINDISKVNSIISEVQKDILAAKHIIDDIREYERSSLI